MRKNNYLILMLLTFFIFSLSFVSALNIDLAVTNWGGGINGHSVSILLSNGSGGFEPYQNYQSGYSSYAIASGDFNNNNFLDLAVTRTGNASISILLGNGVGGFEDYSSYLVGNQPMDIAVSDFNEDGNLDLAVTNWIYAYPQNYINILFGDGNGHFLSMINYGIGVGSSGITVGDFNEDNNIDIVVTNFAGVGNPVVSVFLGNGNGGFLIYNNYATQTIANDIVTGDFNEDGHLDIVTNNYYEDTVSVLLGNGYGGFSPHTEYRGIGVWSQDIAIEDFNRDGHLDLAVTNSFQDNVNLLFGDGNGRFISYYTNDYTVGNYPTGIIAEDFNQDNIPDLAIANYFDDDVSILFNDGNGNFLERIDYSVGNGPMKIAVGDFDSLTMPDIHTNTTKVF